MEPVLHPSTNSVLINQDLAKTRKALVTLGCSYAFGKGAFSAEFVSACRPKRGAHWGDCDYNNKHSPKVYKELCAAFPEYNLTIDEHHNMLETAWMEINNNFGNRLAEDCLENEYTHITMGTPGDGNFSSILKLFLSDINWDLADKIIVILMVTDGTRITVESGAWPQMSVAGLNTAFMTIFPSHWPAKQPGMDKYQALNCGYGGLAFSEILEHINLLKSFRLLDFWCKSKNAEYLLTPAFQHLYNKKEMANALNQYASDNHRLINDPEVMPLLDSYDSNRVVCLPGYSSFGKFCWTKDGFDAPNMHAVAKADEDDFSCDWIMPCCHPSANAHRYMANFLYETIKDYGFLNE